MTHVRCSNIADFLSPVLTKNLHGEDLDISVDLNDPHARESIAEKCMRLLTAGFMYSLPEQVGKFIEQERSHSYALTLTNSDVPIRYHVLNPSLFELSASKIAHFLFPNNFAEYKFIIKPNMDINEEIDAGYLVDNKAIVECSVAYPSGVENVYATAFFLGLEIRSHQCIKSEGKPYLFVDDFSYAFHKVDLRQNVLMDEYRDHKIFPLEKGTLFPNTMLNTNCGDWINMGCDIKKLNDAYKHILNTPQAEIATIIDTAIQVLQSIECPDSQDDSCKAGSHYQHMHEVKTVLSGNYESIKTLQNVEF